MASHLPPLLLIGCGQMGGALFRAWEQNSLAPSVVIDRHKDSIAAPHSLVRSIDEIPKKFAPDAIILAVKPGKAAETIITLVKKRPDLLANAPVIISVMAGCTTTSLTSAFANAITGVTPAVVRAMPNTPSAVGRGMTGLFADTDVGAEKKELSDLLFSAAGTTVWVDEEDQINALTAISGSGPAYVFLLAELLEKAAIEQGLPQQAARLLARKTLTGAGELLDQMPEDAAQLRRNVTSPGGTTAAAIEILNAPENWPASVSEAVAAAVRRARELAA
ncbi:pyrroline-5-carboxylate reductase [Acetobacter oeni]|uniref:Pyrroline-5-carboxylate reductase n=1 Tax=Acetobacter oeni TaxID=304077 RepID=A0A511XGW2_9PROT|nr:pyrroline-5-carboxylate reductase [Acetobacter oeni]MBB3882323.1 pyrroline-5-carboxylate reductase [Acetobacter oeni]NHO18572.1 pyrroline-5-carboxylate reductase [Acetobacter oeni]GBR02219.1 pyrroline-5-carboxylate reductase [Acetobacter oeni LMG 21952]GEN62186.1 pyrroline-5-carboxylate reductase [Acetobacter oeni]